MLVALKKIHIVSISRWVVTIGDGSSRCGVLLSLSPLFLIDMFQAIGEGFDT
jgi:hypothetical protein